MATGLLLDERMVSAQPSLVRALGLTRAVVLQQIHWNMVHDRGDEYEGQEWYPVTLAALAVEIGVSAKVIRHAVSELEADGIIQSCQPEGWSSRRKWYRVNRDHALFVQVPSESDAKRQNGHFSSAKVGASSTSQPVEQEPTDVELPLDGAVLALRRAPVQDVFDFWREQTNHPRAQLDRKRRRAIEWAQANYSDDEIADAIRGAASSPFHQGQNDRGTRYDDLTLICRDAEHLERFLELGRRGPIQQVPKAAGALVRMMKDGRL